MHSIDFLHTGAERIFYVVPESASQKFWKILTKFAPNQIKTSISDIRDWSTTFLLSPKELVKRGCAIYRLIQREGQFVVLAPNAIYCTLASGYSCSETVYFAPNRWLVSSHVMEGLKSISNNPLISFDSIVINAMNEEMGKKTPSKHFPKLRPLLIIVRDRLKTFMGDMKGAKINDLSQAPTKTGPGRPTDSDSLAPSACKECGSLCYTRRVRVVESGTILCCEHAIKMIKKKTFKAKDIEILLVVTLGYLDLTISRLISSNGLKDKIS